MILRSTVEPEAFSAIFDRHFAAIHRYLARRVGVSRADDLAAQTFSPRATAAGSASPTARAR
jgi:DNA-directed RNA polymerase specialized sigma24 family protein